MSLTSRKTKAVIDFAQGTPGPRRGRPPMVGRRRARPATTKRGREGDVEPSLDDNAGVEWAAEEDGARAKKRRYDDDKSSFLSKYFRDMAALDLMAPEQEFEAARNLEELESAIWQALLSHPPTVDFIIGALETCMDNSTSELRALRKAAAATAGTTRKERASFDKTVAKLAPKLRALDTDRQYLDSLLAEVARVRRGASIEVAERKTPLKATSPGMKAWLARVATADNNAARAREAFVLANLRLVVSIARRFNHGRMALADLIQEGNIGLMKAVERYDYRRGFRFSTYASWWIRHAISRALADKGREVRLPVHMIDAHHRLSRAKRELHAKLGRHATVEELAEHSQIAANKIEKMRTYIMDGQVSLDRPVSDEDGRTLLDLLHDPAYEDETPADRMAGEARTEEVRELLRDLKPIEADILRQRFGLEDDREMTLKEIGDKYNLSRERIRQIQEQALTKMRRAMTPVDLD